MYRRNLQELELDRSYNNIILEAGRQEEEILHKAGEEVNRRVQNRT
jgi:hypothetical protein